MGWSALIGAWLAGTLGAAHCLAMCGGFVTALSGSSAPARLRPARELAWAQLPYNLGRLATYGILGVVAGGFGGAMLAVAEGLPVQRALYLLANLALLALAWIVLRGRDGLPWLQHAGARLFGAVQPAMARLIRAEGAASRFALGTLWGLVPCALTYSLLPVALFAGGWWQGALVMLAFGLGTLPNLLAAGWMVARARVWLDRPWLRACAAALLAGFAGVGIYRAIFGAPATLAHGVFCLVY